MLNECRLDNIKEGKFLLKVCQRTTGGVCYGRSGQQEDSGRSRGQQEESRTAGGVEDMVRSRGQREESRTAGGFEDSGGDEDSGRSRGQWEERRTPGDIKKGSIHYLKGSSSLKKGCLEHKCSFNVHYLKGLSLLKKGVFI